MSKLRTSLKISTDARADVCADIVLFMYNNRRSYMSPTSEIYKGKNGWNILEVKIGILNFSIPDIPYMCIENIDKNKWRFKFDLSNTYDMTDFAIINRQDLKNGEKILLLTVINFSGLEKTEFWKVFFNRLPKDFIKEKLN